MNKILNARLLKSYCGFFLWWWIRVCCEKRRWQRSKGFPVARVSLSLFPSFPLPSSCPLACVCVANPTPSPIRKGGLLFLSRLFSFSSLSLLTNACHNRCPSSRANARRHPLPLCSAPAPPSLPLFPSFCFIQVCGVRVGGKGYPCGLFFGRALTDRLRSLSLPLSLALLQGRGEKDRPVGECRGPKIPMRPTSFLASCFWKPTSFSARGIACLFPPSGMRSTTPAGSSFPLLCPALPWPPTSPALPHLPPPSSCVRRATAEAPDAQPEHALSARIIARLAHQARDRVLEQGLGGLEGDKLAGKAAALWVGRCPGAPMRLPTLCRGAALRHAAGDGGCEASRRRNLGGQRRSHQARG